MSMLHACEISLAHRGVLFQDELPESGPRVLEVMRQPIEDKIEPISRAQGSLTYPANFQLVAAMNPSPCGYYGDAVKQCTCSSGRMRANPTDARRLLHRLVVAHIVLIIESWFRLTSR
jgi:predicted ATPase with chaperone activity